MCPYYKNKKIYLAIQTMAIMNPTNILQFILIYTFFLQYHSCFRLRECENEECINIANCPSEMSKLTNNRAKRISGMTAYLMRKKVCGFDPKANLRIKVCCPAPSQPGITYITDCKEFNHESMTKVLPVDKCGLLPPQVSPKIRSGIDVTDHSLPWMAQLRILNLNQEFGNCGGTLISKRFILTAAHCFDNTNSSDISEHIICLGSPDNRKENENSIQSSDNLTKNEETDEKSTQSTQIGNQTSTESPESEDDDGVYPEFYPEECDPGRLSFNISKIVIHPKYNRNIGLRNDIALLFLNEDANYTDSVRPICLPIGKQSCRNLVNQQLQIAGWGKTYEKEEGTSPNLKRGDVKYVLRGVCSEKYRSKHGVSKNQFCAIGDKFETCQGDSGGPIQMEFPYDDDDTEQQNRNITVQYGITSYGDPKDCAQSDKNLPVVYTKVASYLTWIIDTMETILRDQNLTDTYYAPPEPTNGTWYKFKNRTL